MKAAAFSTVGPPEVLRLVDVATPTAGAGEVRVRVKAAGVQPLDCAVRGGWAPPGLSVSLPQIPGNEFAGVIDQVGDGVTGFTTGNEVLGFSTLNCYAEYVVVSAAQIVAKPRDMPWEVAGGFTAGAQTASISLQTLGVGKGDTVLIHAAAGGVGTVAAQLAREWGATVIGTASEANHAYLRSFGTIPVAYGDGLVERVRALAPDGVDAALDAAGGDALYASVELVEDRSRIATIVAFDLVEPLGVRRIQGDRSAARLAGLVELCSQGKLRIHVRETYPLADAAGAHRELETRHGRGKVVLTID
jgi:NADPH:quinone reductase-like Zn-dependent oxidoreductase